MDCYLLPDKLVGGALAAIKVCDRTIEAKAPFVFDA